MAGLTNKQKKEWAESLICRDGLTQKEAAVKVGTSAVTMNRWYKDGNWEKKKRNLILTREAQIQKFYKQLEELNEAIEKRNPGARYPDSKEADTQSKLTANIKTLEVEAGVAEVADVGKMLLNYIRSFNPDKAIEMAELFDEFFKYRLSNS